MLTVERLQAAYGPAQVLFDIGFRINAGEVVTLLGRNGMGKTTTIHTLMGLLPASGGSILFEAARSSACRLIGSPRPASVWFRRAGRSLPP
jgi:ABC-type branched-subunit amino acid transport system ATPase component